ncbi:unnamed protein product [Cylindrotheca closterium]|uniref:Uncharacterized protein n=1 Tax=Cylindrotheca closterium TaxID=2856 RepID=A0AAD2JIQ3_9STRA|nr:unnamed protein product [Cylindrotheca closterium]
MRGRGPRARRVKRDPYNSPFYNVYHCQQRIYAIAAFDSVWDKESTLAKGFWQRFAIPYSYFDQVYNNWNRSGEYKEERSRNGRARIDGRILIMGSLGIYTQDLAFDWMELFTECMDTVPQALAKVMDFYTLLGLPGCIGSIDCVHVGWDGFSAGYHVDAKGKEGFPTLSFEVE